MKSVLIGILLSLVAHSTGAAYTVGELVDGLKIAAVALDSGKDTETGNDKATTAINYLAGSYENIKAMSWFEECGLADDPPAERLYDYNKMEKSFEELIRTVIRYYDTIPMFRDEEASEFLLCFYVFRFGATEKVHNWTFPMIKHMVISSAIRYSRYPKKPNALADWIAQVDRKGEAGRAALDGPQLTIFDYAKGAFAGAQKAEKERRKATP